MSDTTRPDTPERTFASDPALVERIVGVRSLRAEHLTPAHIGLRFVGFGVLTGFSASEGCLIRVELGDIWMTLPCDFRVSYFVDEDAR